MQPISIPPYYDRPKEAGEVRMLRPGRTVCPNSLQMRMADADEEILSALESHLLNPDVIEEAMTRAIERTAQGDTDFDAREARTKDALACIEDELQRCFQRVSESTKVGGRRGGQSLLEAGNPRRSEGSLRPRLAGESQDI